MKTKTEEQFEKMLDKYSYCRTKNYGLVRLLIERHRLAKFMMKIPNTEAGKNDMKQALKRKVSFNAHSVRRDIEEYKALGDIFYEIKKAENINVGLENSKYKPYVNRAIEDTHDQKSYRKNIIVKNAIKLYNDEHSKEQSL